MQIEIPDHCEAEKQAIAAGFASVEQYVVALLDRDAERAAIQEGLDAMKAGRFRPFEDFDREFRQMHNLAAPE
jgi:predicted transcriptional regulator